MSGLGRDMRQAGAQGVAAQHAWRAAVLATANMPCVLPCRHRACCSGADPLRGRGRHERGAQPARPAQPGRRRRAAAVHRRRARGAGGGVAGRGDARARAAAGARGAGGARAGRDGARGRPPRRRRGRRGRAERGGRRAGGPAQRGPGRRGRRGRRRGRPRRGGRRRRRRRRLLCAGVCQWRASSTRHRFTASRSARGRSCITPAGRSMRRYLLPAARWHACSRTHARSQRLCAMCLLRTVRAWSHALAGSRGGIERVVEPCDLPACRRGYGRRGEATVQWHTERPESKLKRGGVRAGLRAGRRSQEHPPGGAGGKRRADGPAGGTTKRGVSAADGDAAADAAPGDRRCLQCGTQVREALFASAVVRYLVTSLVVVRCMASCVLHARARACLCIPP